MFPFGCPWGFLLCDFRWRWGWACFVVIGDISSVEFVARGVSPSSSVGVDEPCWWLVDDGPDASCDVRGFCASLMGGCFNRASLPALFTCCSVRAALAAWAFSAQFLNYRISQFYVYFDYIHLLFYRRRSLRDGVLVLVVFGVFRRIWQCRCCVLQCFFDYVCRW